MWRCSVGGAFFHKSINNSCSSHLHRARYPLAKRKLVASFAGWAPTALSAASSARYSVKVYETKLVVLTIVPSGLTDISPSSQKPRDALVGVAGVPRPRMKHKSSSGVASTGIRQMSISSIAKCIGSGPLQRSGGRCSPCMAAHGSAACRRGICLNHQVLASQSRACTGC